MADLIPCVVKMIRGNQYWPGFQARAKYLLNTSVLTILGAAYEVAGKQVPEITREISAWEDGRRFAIGVLPRGPYITMEKRGEEIHYLGKGLFNPDISMLLKNPDSAVMVFLGRIGSYKAFIENRFLVYGNLSRTMEVNRVSDIVNAYLLPGFMLKGVLKRPPKFNSYQNINKLKVYVLLLPCVLRHLLRRERG